MELLEGNLVEFAFSFVTFLVALAGYWGNKEEEGE